MDGDIDGEVDGSVDGGADGASTGGTGGDTGTSTGGSGGGGASSGGSGGAATDGGSESSTVTPPAAPTNLAAAPGDKQVVLSWTASPDAVSYSISRGTTSGSYTTIATNVLLTDYLDDAVINGTQYFYVVIAVNGAGSSAASNEVSATPLYQRVDSTVFRTYASTNSSNGTVSAASCLTANASCHAVDGDETDTAHAWSSGPATSPYLQVDSGNSAWGKHIDHVTIVYSTTSCSGAGFSLSYHPAGSTNWNAISGTYGCVAGTKATLNVPLDLDAWGLSIQNPASSTTFVVYEVQFWTTN
jgi:hypothetical protein